MKSRNYTLILMLTTIVLFTSCKDQTFIKTENATKEIHSLDGSSRVKIKSYSVTYNPKSNGFIKLKLENEATYQAKSVDGGSFSSISILLQEPGVLFDTTTKEVVLDKFIGN